MEWSFFYHPRVTHYLKQRNERRTNRKRNNIEVYSSKTFVASFSGVDYKKKSNN